MAHCAMSHACTEFVLSIPFQYVPELYSVELDEYSKGLEWAFLRILYCCPMLAEGELEEPDSHV